MIIGFVSNTHLPIRRLIVFFPEIMCDGQETKRIFVWTNFRSLGIAFLKCLSNLPDVQIINSLFTSCSIFGKDSNFPESVSKSWSARGSFDFSAFPLAYDSSTSTYRWAKTQLESDYYGKKYVIHKDSPYGIRRNLSLIPENYHHTFLVRHPYKVYSSYKSIFKGVFNPEEDLTNILDRYFEGYYGFKEQFEIWQHVVEDQSNTFHPVIIDADDLQNHPASIISQYCLAVGIPFTDDLLQWKSGQDVVKNWKASRQLVGLGLNDADTGYYKVAMTSTKFLPARKLPERSELDPDVLKCADISMPYYEKLYDMRIKP